MYPGIDDLLSAEKLVFPGVGNFGSMMRILNDKNYVRALKDYLFSDRPFLGICLGLHALFEKSEEAPGTKGLGLISGQVKKFDIHLSVPHIGWNGINIKKPSRIFKRVAGVMKNFTLYIHFTLYRMDDSVVLTTTNYGIEFVSGIQKGNITATQFHPEKSGASGIKVLKNFIEPGSEKKAITHVLKETPAV